MEDKKTQLLELIKREAVFKGNFVLASGKESSYYLDLRLITLNPEGAYLIAEVLFDLLTCEDVDFLGGLTLGADPICGAFSAISYLKGKPIPSFIVRKEEKKHGKTKAIEGPLRKGARVAIVDDVATSGGSLLRAINAVKEQACEIVSIIVIVDREEGAKEKLAEEGYMLLSIFNKKDLGL
ncbi:MAG: orotate phosphoribosyltransferase [Candidatus Altiarchaeota archaeon]|nr:orotate phosphoribosyltransferase [Candidatus Altiarchaeota archaeon]